MIVKKIVKWFRNRGYDDFYLADLADKYEGVLFFLVFVLQFLVIVGLLSVLDYLLPKSIVEMFFSKGENISGILRVVGIVILVSIFSPPILLAVIKDKKRKGETDLRIMYIISSNISKLGLKLIRNAPVISAVILVAYLIYSLSQYGFYFRILEAFSLRLLLLLLIFRLYHKLLSRVMKEAMYYVEWKTHQIVDNFDERYSGYEIWRIPPSEMDFEQFNVWHFRNICQTAFVCVSVGCITVFIYALSFSPISCMSCYDRGKTEQTEELYEKPSSGETEEVKSSRIDKEPEESIEPEVKETVTSDGAEDIIEVEEDNIIEKIKTEEETVDVEEGRETEAQNTRHYHSYELDVQPTMNNGRPLNKEIPAYLIERVMELDRKYVDMTIEISPAGKIYSVDASIDDRELLEKIRNVLLSMPNVIPGEKDGHAVYVSTRITIEYQDTRHYHLNELDVQPAMNDGSSLKRGIATYLIGHITELKGNHVYVGYEINPVGKIFVVDASLVYDLELREKICNVLLSMPNVIPGKKDGHAVFVSTNITIERDNSVY